jgi:hypothetical protein
VHRRGGSAEEPGTDERPTESPTPGGEGDWLQITARSFTRTGDASDPGESASVAFDGDSVRVSGVVSGKNGCMRASLKAVEYDPEGDELSVRVETVREGGDVCTQQTAYRGYKAIVEFAGGLPASVVVEHESMGEVRVVTDVTR